VGVFILTGAGAGCMDVINDLIRDDLLRVDQEFRKNLQSNVPITSDIGEYLLSSGGKRFRARLLLLAARLCGYQGDAHIAMASLIEFIHTATLLHDDVVDGAGLRRGNDSANTLWGNEASVLVGDFLFTKCFSLMVRLGNLKILQTVSEATTLMAEGELEELIRTNDLDLTEGDYLSIIGRKTGVLISAAARIGALLGNVSEDKEKSLEIFGMNVGMAFQLTDDSLDYTSRQEEFGKAIGIDLQEGKITLPLIAALRRSTAEERSFLLATVEADPLTRDAFARVVEIIHRYDGITYTRDKAGEFLEKAKERLLIFPDSEMRGALFGLADYVLQRKL
jgi:octaprenyl-diphosphate synthase